MWGALGGDGPRGSGAAPFAGDWRWRLGWHALPSFLLVVGSGAAFARPARRARWRHLLLGAALLAVVWALALSLVEGPDALADHFNSRFHYMRHVPFVDSPGDYLRNFVEELPHEANHVKTHPPGIVLLFWLVDRIGLGGAGGGAVLVLLAIAVVPVSAAVALRDVVGEQGARVAVPFLAMTPAAVWMAVSEDALFAAVTACGITGVILATSRVGPTSHAWALGGGVALGAAMFLSYGTVALWGVPLAVAVVRRRWGPVALASLGVGAVVLGFLAAGFWWPEGLVASLDRVDRGISNARPYGYYVLGNVAAFAVALGPAVAVALSRLRPARHWLLPGVALAPLAVITLWGFWRGETERLWLPFVAWVTTATVALATSERPTWVRWLGINAGAGFLLQLSLDSPW